MPRKKNQAFGLGRTLIKSRFGNRKSQSAHLHAAEVAQENETGGMLTDNLKSVVELDELDDFLATAELAGTEFTAERLNVRYMDPKTAGLIPVEKIAKISQLQIDIEKMLSVPRRPKWDLLTTKEELDRAEKDSFLEWRRHLAKIQEENTVELTPYEKNLDFWRQLWRVVERSDVIVQIVDARDPLLYRCEDLEKYVQEVNSQKVNIVLVNKADFLSPQQRRIWRDYWNSVGVRAVFWSALMENEKLEADTQEQKKKDQEQSVQTPKNENEVRNEESDSDDEDDDDDSDVHSDVINDDLTSKQEDNIEDNNEESDEQQQCKEEDDKAEKCEEKEEEEEDIRLLTREELITYFKTFRKPSQVDRIVIGMVGYPNVGKSSTVNTLMGSKRVAVSATPGRTKHFQTLLVDEELCLCDCPGLVFPSYISNTAEMVLCGILPIDQMRDYVAPINLLASRISRTLLNAFYGIRIPTPRQHEPQDRAPTSSELLDAHALSRGFMTAHGQPDNSRSARLVLKDYVNGKLVYSRPPPDGDIAAYRATTPMLSEVRSIVDEKKYRSTQQQILAEQKKQKEEQIVEEDIDIATFVVGSVSRSKRDKELGKKKHFKKKEKMRRRRTVQY